MRKTAAKSARVSSARKARVSKNRQSELAIIRRAAALKAWITIHADNKRTAESREAKTNYAKYVRQHSRILAA